MSQKRSKQELFESARSNIDLTHGWLQNQSSSCPYSLHDWCW